MGGEYRWPHLRFIAAKLLSTTADPITLPAILDSQKFA